MSWPQRAKKLKIMAIPVLSLVLLYLLFGSSDPATEVPQQVALAQPARTAAAPAATLAAPPPPSRPWPLVDLERLAEFSPFDAPAGLLPAGDSQVTAVERHGESDTASSGSSQNPPSGESGLRLLSGRVQALYHTAEGSIALIDSRIVRPGDLLDGGARVVAISPQGVVIETAE